jgi:hypothetical protein
MSVVESCISPASCKADTCDCVNQREFAMAEFLPAKLFDHMTMPCNKHMSSCRKYSRLGRDDSQRLKITIRACQASLFFQFTQRGTPNRFTGLDEPSGNLPEITLVACR